MSISASAPWLRDVKPSYAADDPDHSEDEDDDVIEILLGDESPVIVTHEDLDDACEAEMLEAHNAEEQELTEEEEDQDLVRVQCQGHERDGRACSRTTWITKQAFLHHQTHHVPLYCFRHSRKRHKTRRQEIAQSVVHSMLSLSTWWKLLFTVVGSFLCVVLMTIGLTAHALVLSIIGLVGLCSCILCMCIVLMQAIVQTCPQGSAPVVEIVALIQDDDKCETNPSVAIAEGDAQKQTRSSSNAAVIA